MKYDEIDAIFDRLFSFYDVASISELALKMNTTQPTISNWKSRNSTMAIKKRCRELGIYDKIFGINEINNIHHSTVSNGSSVIDNSNQKVQAFNSNQYPDTPEYLLEDINSLFKRVAKVSKVEELIAKFDEFIYQQKKTL